MNANHTYIYSKTARWITLGLLGLDSLLPLAAHGAPPPIPPDLTAQIAQNGTARIIVELDVPWQPEGMLRGADAVVAQRQQLTDTQQQFVTTLSQDLVNSGLFDAPNSADGTPIVKPEATYETIPYLVLEVSDATLPLVQQQTLTKGVTLDHADEPSLTQSLPLIGADKAWSAGYTGQGQQIAVLDTGVEKTHSFFATNRVVQEACFSATFCPDGQKQQVSAGAAVPCNYDAPNCLHGTHVAGIAASVAKDAQLIAVQVFSKQLGTAKSLQSDQLLALDWLHKTYGNPDSKLAAVNLSLGGGKFASACDDDPRKKAIDNLRSVGIATIVSSGNQGYSDGINAPACVSSAISVGATDKADTLWASSNSASLLNLLAPGVDIVSSVPGGQTLAMSGTSMAAPHVAGAWAVLKAAKPTATVDELLTTLQSTGKAVTGKGVTKARVQLDAAVLQLSPPTANVLFQEDFEGDWSKWAIKGSAVIVADPLNSGRGHVVTFTGLAAAGDLRSQSVSNPSAKYILSFDYLGLAKTGSVSDNFGGFIGYDSSHWLAGTQADYPGDGYGGLKYHLQDTGQWTHVMFEFTGNTNLYLILEDTYLSGGVAGDAYFDNIILSAVKEQTTPTTTSCDAVKDGLVACYPFDGDAKDYSGNGNDGTEYGNIEYVDGIINKAKKFTSDQGTVGYVTVPNTAIYEDNEFSISLWWTPPAAVTPDNELNHYNILRLEATPAVYGPYLDLTTSMKRLSVRLRGDTLYHRITDPAAFKNSKELVANFKSPFLITVMYKKNQLSVYVNGELYTNYVITGFFLPTSYLKAQQTITIGGDSISHGGYPLYGSLDEFRIYNRALSEVEVKQLYDLGANISLTVTKTGSGTGEVKSLPENAINCGSICQTNHAIGKVVTLTATPVPGSQFQGWSGDCSSKTSIVTITMDKAKTCTVTFDKKQTSTTCDMVNDGLVACYPFDGDVRDYTGNGLHGTEYGEVEYVNGPVNQAKKFSINGTADYVTIPNVAIRHILDSTGNAFTVNEFTVNFWWAPPEGLSPAFGHFNILRLDGNPYVYGPYLDLTTSAGKLSFRLRGNILYGVDPAAFTNSKELIPNFKSPYLITMMYKDQQFSVYVNTELYTKYATVSSCGLRTAQTMRIGGDGVSGGYPLNGAIDDLRLYNRAISEAEIQQLYALGTKVTLTVTKTGNGQITGNGITCGTDCTEDLAPNTQVTLTATATTGSIFKQWTGDCTGTTATVTVTMDKAKSCSATFELLPTYTLNVTKTGNGNLKGTGIDCGTDCTEANLAANTQVTLTATPDAGNQFAGWAGACTGTEATTTVTMTADQTCEAKFMPTGIPLTVKKADVDNGRISGRLRGETTVSLTCDSACQTASYNYPKDGVVILTATADPGYEFKTWSCTGSSYTPGTQPNIIKVTMTTATTCTANFDVLPGALNLTVNLIGTGMGSVTPSKGGLDCQGTQCTGAYATGSKVLLTAKPSPFSTFVNWGGDCTGNSLKVTVTLTKDVTCTVQFQSLLETAAAELVNLLYTDGFLTNNADVASQFPLASNQDRLQEAFWLASTAILQADTHLAATQEWPTQLTGTQWYSKTPIGKYTQSIQLQPGESVDVRVKLLDQAGMEQEVVIVIYYGTTPPIPAGDGGSGRQSIPIYFPASFFARWYG